MRKDLYTLQNVYYMKNFQKRTFQRVFKEMRRHFANRLTSKTGNEKWETFDSFYLEVDNKRTLQKDDENKLKLLEGYDNYVQSMQKKFENA